MINNNILERIEKEIREQFPLKATKEYITAVSANKNSCISIEDMDYINRPCHELLERGGKRWRPLLLILTALSYGTDREMAFKLAPIIELIHNGTLLVDDIEDNSVERRGKPAVHLIYGEDVTINSGNHLYFCATQIFEEINIEESLKLDLYRSFCENMRRLHLGQGMDIKWHRELNFIPNVNEYMQMCKYKTGCLASMAGEFAGIISNVDKSVRVKLRENWENIGVGFQIMDDIKNITTGIPGKERGDDIVEGKKSLPVILYCNKYDKRDLLNFMHKSRTDKSYIEKAITLLEKTEVINESKVIAETLINSSLNNLKEIMAKNEYRDELLSVFKCFLN